MTNFVLPIWPTPSVAVAGGGRHPVRHIYCVGRNYAAHVREMGIDAREPGDQLHGHIDGVGEITGTIG